MKKGGYHVNPILRKKEEELHLKNMEKKIRAAKSTLPPGAKSGRVASKIRASEYQDSIDIVHDGCKEDAPQNLDGIIKARLEDVLRQSIIQNIQSLVRQKMPQQDQIIKRELALHTETPLPSSSARPYSRRRPEWNDEWASTPSVLTQRSSPRPSPVKASSSLARSPSNGTRSKTGSRAGRPPSGPCPPPVIRYLSPGSITPRGTGDTGSTSASKNRIVSTSRGGILPVIEARCLPDEIILGTHYGTESEKPSCSSASISVTPAPSAPRSSERAASCHRHVSKMLSESHSDTIAVLNPLLNSRGSALNSQGPGQEGIIEISQQSAQHATIADSFKLPPKDKSYALDRTMMSLARLTTEIQANQMHDTAGGHSSALSDDLGGTTFQENADIHHGLDGHDGASCRDLEVNQMTGQDVEEYEDDFEAVEDVALDVESDPDSAQMVPFQVQEVRSLRASVAALQLYVNMKISALADDEAEYPTGHQATNQDQSVLDQTQDLDLGSAGSLQPLSAYKDLVELHESELEYLDMHQRIQPEGDEEDEETGSPSMSQHDLIEVAEPVANTCVWGDRSGRPLGHDVSNREFCNNKLLATPAGSLLELTSEVPPLSGNARSSLAVEAKALYASLCQLNDLMRSPSAQAGLLLHSKIEVHDHGAHNNQATAQVPPSSRLSGQMEESVGLAARASQNLVSEMYTAPQIKNQNLHRLISSTQSQAVEGFKTEDPPVCYSSPPQHVPLTPRNQLCAADVQWMASLMQTLSTSMECFNTGDVMKT
ncbi:hypothetical protein CEUSTIGMA_g10198.t1 [Chlamydomonas eustigma]|uniref:Uncharacterized protein n=1 Tax=Chlamydomonas eustigma TaxID=1157962 RepID=A0A250XIP3_9CHLO|nr:hypothetical protein CEUSTIGMA_g10198.t1 [Chlamydomonas eustigma]|eukprot:GAX82772.1 hypothetical protein CEUSTIGMA_g10198.t1 [Chlamydomonas eustigma]